METQYISLNMTPTGVNPCFHISQYDIGRPLGFKVHNGAEVVDLDSYTCTIEATRSDGVAITASVTTDDNVGTFETTATMTNKADKYKAQFVIVDGNSNRIASLPFDIDVVKAAMDENSEAIEEDASLYQQYTDAVQGAIAEANADIQAEENARIAAVNAEATARANADTTLQNNIDAEATARQTADNTLQTNINSEASTRASADSNLQSQINQIIAPSGEAPSAAEVQNARIGADGVTYDTLGEAIRTQVSYIKDNVSVRSVNLFNGDDSNGLEGSNATITLLGDETIRVTASISNYVCVALKEIDVSSINSLSIKYACKNHTGSVSVRLHSAKSTGSSARIAFIDPDGTIVDVSSYNTVYLLFYASVASDQYSAGVFCDYSEIMVADSSNVVDYVPYTIWEPKSTEALEKVNSIMPKVTDMYATYSDLKCTKNANVNSQGITVKTSTEQSVLIYGTAGGRKNFNVLGGASEFLSGDVSATTYIPAGTYRLRYAFNRSDVDIPEIYVTESTVNAGMVLSNGDMFTLNSTGAVIFGFYKNNSYGTESNPLILTFNLQRCTAIDNVAREEIRERDVYAESFSDANLKNITTRNDVIDTLASNTPLTTLRANNLIEGVKAVINRHSAKYSTIKFAFITDTHVGGARTTTHDSQYNIAAFIRTANAVADFAVVCGDIITNYYNATYMPDKNAVKTALASAANTFTGLTIPLMMVKGNHDTGLNGYTAVSAPDTFVENTYFCYDSTTGTYYLVKTEDEFEEYVDAGYTFYTVGYDYITNEEYYNLCQAPFADDYVYDTGVSYGGYYYYDVPNTNLRIIVLNEYFASTGLDETQKAFVNAVMNDALSNNLAVITFSHTISGGNIIRTYINDFINSGGVYIGHIHGHTHSDVYYNAQGFNNIGVNWGCIPIGDTEKMSGFVFDLFEIDLANKNLFENRIGAWRQLDNTEKKNLYRSEDRRWSFDSHTELI